MDKENNIVYVQTKRGIFKCYKSEQMGKPIYYPIESKTNELFILKDMIYKPETREENFEIQRKISSIIKRLNGKEV